MTVEINYPGVYIEEIANRPKSIRGVDTSVTAFAGWSPSGPTDRAELVSSWSEYEQKFGGAHSESLLGYSIRHFFENGGSRAYVVRLGGEMPVQPNDSTFEEALLPGSGAGGLYLLDGIALFNLLCVPGETTPGIILQLQAFCRARRAFLIVDCPKGVGAADALAYATSIAAEDSRNSAAYVPWVTAADPLAPGASREFPPSGFVAGVFSRTDATRGFWKAPAGTDAPLKGALGIDPDNPINDSQNDLLNRQGINCIRTFPIHGTAVWGARTLDGSDTRASDWKYIPVRRTALFIEESLYRGLQWVVFEPNDEPLWAQIRLTVGDFLFGLFREGALMGTKADEAYFVKCDSATMTQNDIDNGVVNIVVGFAPIKPAEFVIIKIQLMTARPDGSSGTSSGTSKLQGGVVNKFVVNTKRKDPYKNFNFRLKRKSHAPSWEDVSLPNEKRAVLDQMIAETRGGALFSGSTGTGKTMVAEVLAEEMGRDLYRVDLSMIRSRYIGETEKHLARIFEAAESSGAVLFFDEADALFGKRSEVKDSHDRYANLEVDYLLRLLENYEGPIILATNNKSNIDPAFQRRLRYEVEFP